MGSQQILSGHILYDLTDRSYCFSPLINDNIVIMFAQVNSDWLFFFFFKKITITFAEPSAAKGFCHVRRSNFSALCQSSLRESLCFIKSPPSHTHTHIYMKIHHQVFSMMAVLKNSPSQSLKILYISICSLGC